MKDILAACRDELVRIRNDFLETIAQPVRTADQYESYGDGEQAKACAQTATAMAAAARTIEKGNE